MAEATVESPHLSSMFFCHECQREIKPNIPAYTCSRCNSGFIEELESQPAASSSSYASTSASNHTNNPFNQPTTMTDPAAQFADMFNLWRTRHQYNTRQQANNQAQVLNRQMGESNVDDSDEDEMWGVSVAPPGSADRVHRPHTYHSIINYVIQNLTNDLGGALGGVMIHANPGDYAWGTGGLDDIISQLLNQLEGTGAPPAQRETIDGLPKVTIEQSHVDSQLQCSICMDDFELAQEVQKLPCDHLYHSDCIVRWLEMHGTCPVCRKGLNGEDTTTNEANFSNIYPNTANAAPSASTSNSSMDLSTSSSYSADFD